MRLYGRNCEICNISITELHHIVPKSKDIKDWAILCPLCHSIITRGLVKIRNRNELKTKLKPFVRNIYKDLKFL